MASTVELNSVNSVDVHCRERTDECDRRINTALMLVE